MVGEPMIFGTWRVISISSRPPAPRPVLSGHTYEEYSNGIALGPLERYELVCWHTARIVVWQQPKCRPPRITEQSSSVCLFLGVRDTTKIANAPSVSET
jgi:hypothetical protein